MNSTLGPEGLHPSLSVCECILRFPCTDSSNRKQNERKKVLGNAREEIALITEKLLIQKALKSRFSRNASIVINNAELVCLYRETDLKYIWPFPVLRTDGKQINILDNSSDVPYRLDKVILVSEYDKIVNGNQFSISYPAVCSNSSHI